MAWFGIQRFKATLRQLQGDRKAIYTLYTTTRVLCSALTHTHTHTTSKHTYITLFSHYSLTLLDWSFSLLEALTVLLLILAQYSALCSLFYKYPQCLYSWIWLLLISATNLHSSAPGLVLYLCLLSSPEFSFSIPSPDLSPQNASPRIGSFHSALKELGCILVSDWIPEKRHRKSQKSLRNQYSKEKRWDWPKVKF